MNEEMVVITPLALCHREGDGSLNNLAELIPPSSMLSSPPLRSEAALRPDVLAFSESEPLLLSERGNIGGLVPLLKQSLLLPK